MLKVKTKQFEFSLSAKKKTFPIQHASIRDPSTSLVSAINYNIFKFSFHFLFLLRLNTLSHSLTVRVPQYLFSNFDASISCNCCGAVWQGGEERKKRYYSLKASRRRRLRKLKNASWRGGAKQKVEKWMKWLENIFEALLVLEPGKLWKMNECDATKIYRKNCQVQVATPIQTIRKLSL